MHKDDVMTLLEEHREELLMRAQGVIDMWNWSNGGVCDAIAEEIVLALDELEGIDAYSHSQDGGDHTWVVVPVGDDVIEVDIPWEVYEKKHGFCRYAPTYRDLDIDDIEFTFLKIDPALLALDYV